MMIDTCIFTMVDIYGLFQFHIIMNFQFILYYLIIYICLIDILIYINSFLTFYNNQLVFNKFLIDLPIYISSFITFYNNQCFVSHYYFIIYIKLLSISSSFNISDIFSLLSNLLYDLIPKFIISFIIFL